MHVIDLIVNYSCMSLNYYYFYIFDLVIGCSGEMIDFSLVAFMVDFNHLVYINLTTFLQSTAFIQPTTDAWHQIFCLLDNLYSDVDYNMEVRSVATSVSP